MLVSSPVIPATIPATKPQALDRVCFTRFRMNRPLETLRSKRIPKHFTLIFSEPDLIEGLNSAGRGMHESSWLMLGSLES